MALNVGDELDLTFRQGETFHEMLENREADEVTVIPFLPGTTAVAEVRASGILQLTLTCTVDAAGGNILLEASDEETDAMDKGGRWDIFVLYPDGTSEMYLRGKAKFVPRVTQVVAP